MNDPVIRDYVRHNNLSVSNINNAPVIVLDEAKMFDCVLRRELINSGETMNYIVCFNRLDQSDIQLLISKGAIVGGYIPDNSVIVRIPEGLDLRRLPDVKSVYSYQPYMKIPSVLSNLSAGDIVKVSLWNETFNAGFAEFCRNNGVEIVDSSGSELYIRTTNLVAVLFEDAVLKVEPYYESAIFSITANGVRDRIAKPLSQYGIGSGGSGVCVSVFDVGIDANHNDIRDRLRSVYEVSGDDSVSEFVSHGTHIAGIIAGNGNNSSGRVTGVNPGATIDFYAMGDTLKGIVVPASMDKYFNLMLFNRSYIANLSWGTFDGGLEGRYLSISRDIDQYIYEHPELIIVTAVGNNGVSIASPATAKNVISVGALDGSSLADYSGRNGCYDSRTKPDIVVQGSSVESLNLNNSYVTHSGTSQSAAVVSGIVSELYTLVADNYGIRPTHSLIKAILVADTTGDAGNGFGFGKVWFNRAISDTNFIIRHWTSSSSVEETVFYLSEGDEVNAVLCWTEPPSSESAIFNLVNDFDVQAITPSGETISVGDRVNNVEKLRFTASEAGKYTVRVVPKQVIFEVNDISLVVRSLNGFADETQDEETTDVTVADSDVVDSTQTSDSSYSAGDTGDNEGIADSGADSGSTLPDSGTLTVDENSGQNESASAAWDSGASVEDAFASMDSGNTNAGHEVIQLYGRNGDNVFYVRAIGINLNDLVCLKISCPGVNANEIVVPIEKALDGHYVEFSVNIENVGESTTGYFIVKKINSTLSNVIPVQFNVDNTPPEFGDRYPPEGGTLTEPCAWIGITDDRALDSDMQILLNNNILYPSAYFYNYGTRKLTIDLSKVLPPFERQDAAIRFARVSDTAGNVAPQEVWSFIYCLSNDTTPPASPAGVAVSVTNKLVSVNWLTNGEADLAGYYVYLVGSDYAILSRRTPQLLTTNFYEFEMKDVEQIGVSAVDRFSNESALSIVPVDYHYQNYPPEILIENVPESTNRNFTAFISFIDEGYIVSTNVKLVYAETAADSNDQYVEISSGIYWQNGLGKLPVNQSGYYQLTVWVMDNDSNFVTNIAEFMLDKDAPNPVEVLTWVQQGRDADFCWSDGNNSGERFYRFYIQNKLVKDNITATNFFYQFGDYGSYNVAVTVVDELGNESPTVNRILNMEKGIVAALDDTVVRDALSFEAEMMLSTNSYDSIVICVSNRGGKRVWNYDPAFSIRPILDLSGLADGQYKLKIMAYLNGMTLYQGGSKFATNIVIDKTLPEILFENGGNVVPGNYHISGVSNYMFSVIDENFDRSSAMFDNTKYIEYGEKIVPFFVERDTALVLYAFDRAGNCSSRAVTFIYDADKPDITVSSVDTYVSGIIRDAHFYGYDVFTNGSVYYHSDFSCEGRICLTPNITGSLAIAAYDYAGNTNRFVTNIDRVESEESNYIAEIFVNGVTNAYYSLNRLKIGYDGHLYDLIRYTLYNGSRQIIVDSGYVGSSNYTIEGLSDGGYIVEVSSGNLSLTKEIVVDTTEPSITLPSAALPRNSVLSSVVTVRDDNLRSVVYTVNDEEVQPNYVFHDGSFALSVFASDFAGNIASAFKQIDVVNYRTNYAVANFTGIEDGMFYNTPVTFDIEETASKIKYYVNGLQQTNTIKKDGVYTIRVWAEAGGYVKTIYTNTIRITIDMTPPNVVSGIEEGGYYVAVPAISVYDDFLMSQAVKIDGTNWTGQQLADGIHRVEVTADDYSGNEAQVVRHFYIDTTPPSVVIDPVDGVFRSVTPAVSVQDLSLDRTILALNNESFTLNDTINKEGNYTFSVYASDRVGHSRYATAVYAIDLTPPSVGLSVIDGKVYRTNMVIVPAISDPHIAFVNKWLDGSPYDGEKITNIGAHTISVRAVDRAGNSAELERSFYIAANVPQIIVSGIEGTLISNVYYSSVGFHFTSFVSNGNMTSIQTIVNGDTYGDNVDLMADGNYRIDVLATAELSGTVYDIAETVYLVVDRTLPVITVSGVRDSQYANYDLSVRVDMSDNLIQSWLKLNGADTTNAFTVVSEGSYSLSAFAKDVLNRISVANIDFVIDKTPPVIAITGIDDLAKYNHPVTYSVAVTEANLSNTTITLNGSAAASSVTVSQSGTYTLAVVSVDKAGNSAERTVSFTIDMEAPVITFSQFTNGMAARYLNSQASVSIADNSMKAYEITFSGPDGTVVISGPTNAVYVFGWMTNEGIYSNSVKAIDNVNNTNIQYFTFAVDRTKPAITIDGVTDGGCYPATVIYSVSVSDANPGSTLVRMNGSAAAWCGTNTAEGGYTLVVSSIDLAGNSSVLTNRFIIDRTKPVINISGVSDGGIYNSDRNVVVSFTEANLAGYYIEYNGSLTNMNFTASEEGVNDLYVEVFDSASNYVGTNISFVIDRTPPVIAFSGIADGAYVQSGTLGIAVSDATFEWLEYTVNGATTNVAVPAMNLLFQSGSGYTSEGLYAIHVEAGDSVGNTSSADISFTIDRTPPEVEFYANGSLVNPNGSFVLTNDFSVIQQAIHSTDNLGLSHIRIIDGYRTNTASLSLSVNHTRTTNLTLFDLTNYIDAGAHTAIRDVVIDLYDMANNQLTGRTFHYGYADTIAPTITYTPSTTLKIFGNMQALKDNYSISLELSDAGGVDGSSSALGNPEGMSWTGSAYNTMQYIYYMTCSSGVEKTNTFYISAIDLFGNKATNCSVYGIDKLPPRLEVRDNDIHDGDVILYAYPTNSLKFNDLTGYDESSGYIMHGYQPGMFGRYRIFTVTANEVFFIDNSSYFVSWGNSTTPNYYKTESGLISSDGILQPQLFSRPITLSNTFVSKYSQYGWSYAMKLSIVDGVGNITNHYLRFAVIDPGAFDITVPAGTNSDRFVFYIDEDIEPYRDDLVRNETYIYSGYPEYYTYDTRMSLYMNMGLSSGSYLLKDHFQINSTNFRNDYYYTTPCYNTFFELLNGSNSQLNNAIRLFNFVGLGMMQITSPWYSGSPVIYDERNEGRLGQGRNWIQLINVSKATTIRGIYPMVQMDIDY